jgi:hypothetical protein
MLLLEGVLHRTWMLGVVVHLMEARVSKLFIPFEAMYVLKS